MDRREALKKMAVGGAGIVGATAVMTSTAFAYDAPYGILTPPTLTDYGKISWYAYNSKIQLKFTPGAPKCPGSATKGYSLVSMKVKFTSATLNNPPGSGATDFGVRQIKWGSNGLTGSFGYGTNPVGNYVTLIGGKTSESSVPNTALGYFLYLVKTNAAGNHHGDDTRWTTNDQLNFTLEVTWACVYGDNTRSDTRSWYYTGSIKKPNDTNFNWGVLTTTLVGPTTGP